MYLYSTLFFFNDPPTTEIYTLSLHDALPISNAAGVDCIGKNQAAGGTASVAAALVDQPRRCPAQASEAQAIPPQARKKAQGGRGRGRGSQRQYLTRGQMVCRFHFKPRQSRIGRVS